DERDPRHHRRRGDHRRRTPGSGDLDPHRRPGGGGARHRQRRRRLRRHRPHARDVQAPPPGEGGGDQGDVNAAEAIPPVLATVDRRDAINLAYIVTIVCFILALRFLSPPARARYGNWIGAFGMTVAIVATFFRAGMHNYASILIVMAIAAPLGAYAARAVKM